MNVNERLASIIKSKGLTRKEFAQKLIDLSPKVSRIGETPTVSTIYGYLNGRINIPLDLISFIAEALDISEQELFDTSENARRKYFNFLVENSTQKELDFYQKILSNKRILDFKNIDDFNLDTFENQNIPKIEEITKNLKFAPTEFLDKILTFLEKYKDITYKFDD